MQRALWSERAHCWFAPRGAHALSLLIPHLHLLPCKRIIKKVSCSTLLVEAARRHYYQRSHLRQRARRDSIVTLKGGQTKIPL
jgi:hypothetical protein